MANKLWFLKCYPLINVQTEQVLNFMAIASGRNDSNWNANYIHCENICLWPVVTDGSSCIHIYVYCKNICCEITSCANIEIIVHSLGLISGVSSFYEHISIYVLVDPDAFMVLYAP